MCAAMLASSPGFHATLPTPLLPRGPSGETQRARCSSSFTPSEWLNHSLSSSSRRDRPCAHSQSERASVTWLGRHALQLLALSTMNTIPSTPHLSWGYVIQCQLHRSFVAASECIVTASTAASTLAGRPASRWAAHLQHGQCETLVVAQMLQQWAQAVLQRVLGQAWVGQQERAHTQLGGGPDVFMRLGQRTAHVRTSTRTICNNVSSAAYRY